MSDAKDAVQVYVDTIERMEPNITMVGHDAAMASIAISLKRIADALNSPNEFGSVGFILAELLARRP